MKLQNILDLSTFEITRFRIWNQTSQPSDKGLGSKYFNTNSGHEAYGREQIYTPIGWRTAAYMDDIEAINEKLDLIFGDEIDTDTIIDSWKEVQEFLAGIEDTTTLITLLDDKLSKSKGGTMTGLLAIQNEGAAWISFRSASASFGSLGMNESGPKYWNGSQTFNIIHSGNIGDYAIKKAAYFSIENSVNVAGFGGTENGWLYNGAAMILGYDQNYRWAIQAAYMNATNHKIVSRYYLEGAWTDWKTIAFTDSDITGNAASASIARNLKSTDGKIYAYFSDSLKYTVFGVGDYDAYIDGNKINFRSGESLKTVMLINSSGNVTIGDSDLALSTYRAYVKGDAYISGFTTLANAVTLTGQTASSSLLRFSRVGASFIMAPEEGTINISVTGQATLASSELRITSGAITRGTGRTVSLGSSQYPWNGVFSTFGEFSSYLNVAGLANLNGGALIPTGKNMMFGDASGNAIMEYDEDAGAIKITGSVYATGTVASGGKAQEGIGTAGSATVYQFTLTYGQSAYQIYNPKRDTNVIVQVYEWNSTTSSWDLILTDVNVIASKITVTFGRTTTVNHMVTVV